MTLEVSLDDLQMIQWGLRSMCRELVDALEQTDSWVDDHYRSDVNAKIATVTALLTRMRECHDTATDVLESP